MLCRIVSVNGAALGAGRLGVGGGGGRPVKGVEAASRLCQAAATAVAVAGRQVLVAWGGLYVGKGMGAGSIASLRFAKLRWQGAAGRCLGAVFAAAGAGRVGGPTVERQRAGVGCRW